MVATHFYLHFIGQSLILFEAVKMFLGLLVLCSESVTLVLLGLTSLTRLLENIKFLGIKGGFGFELGLQFVVIADWRFA